VCGRQHDSRQKLLKHATLHTLIDNQGQTIQPEEMISLNNAFAPRECPICHKKFFNQEKLDQHTQNFHNDSHEHTPSSQSVIYKCELCASSHASRIDRWWHMYHSHSTDERVTCALPTCRKVFVTQVLKEEHCKTHHEAQGEYTNTCEICGKLWESRTVFYKHMMNVHPKCLPTICGVCMKIFSNVPELRHHVKGEHPSLDEASGICCDVCGRSYAERSKMLRHRRVHNVTDGVPFTPSMIKKKDDLQCSICPDLVFETLDTISEHRRSVHQLFVCDLCPKFYNGNNHLWKHVSKQHKGDPNVTCDICLRTSASRAHLYRHKLKYHSDPVDRLIARTPAGDVVPQVHKCPLCNREFRIRSLLKKHSKSCKGIKPLVQKVQPVNGVFPCSKCGKVFEQQGVLSKHMRNSHITHYCEVCPEVEPKVGFEKKSDLLLHIRQLHPNDPELVCDVDGCDKVLRMKADLQKHKLEHTRGYFTYICDCCGDMFSNRKKLRKHLITIHRSDVQHLCGVCVAILPSITELTEHLNANHPTLLQRPFTCQICGKCYSATSKTVDHITKVHGAEYKPCKICWKIFTIEKEFEDHVENHPPMDEKPVAPTVKKEPATPRVRPSKSSFHNELTALGIDYDSEILGKRGADDDLENEDSGKRLRKKYKCPSCKDTFRSILELNEHSPQCNGNQVCTLYDEVDNGFFFFLWVQILRHLKQTG
jgi:ribosome-binding protein aMBF1 (putative translation factor)